MSSIKKPTIYPSKLNQGLKKDGESTRCHCEIYGQVNGTNTCTLRAQMTAGWQPSQRNEGGLFAHPENWKAHRVLTSGILIPSVMQTWCWTTICNHSTELPERLASELPLLPCKSGQAQSHPRLHGKGSLVSWDNQAFFSMQAFLTGGKDKAADHGPSSSRWVDCTHHLLVRLGAHPFISLNLHFPAFNLGWCHLHNCITKRIK